MNIHGSFDCVMDSKHGEKTPRVEDIISSHDHLQQLLEALNNPKDYHSKLERKSQALLVSSAHIPHLNIVHCVEFADALRTDNIGYVREERGVIRRVFSKTGNTRTFKRITGMLKDQILSIMVKDTNDQKKTFDELAEQWREVEPFMISTRGRISLPLKYFYMGKTGKFFREIEKRFETEDENNVEKMRLTEDHFTSRNSVEAGLLSEDDFAKADED